MFSTFPSGGSWPTTTRGGLPRTHRILFYHRHDPHYGFTNFSPHPVVFKGKRYPTSEHLFQSFKFQSHRPDLAEHIRTCSERPSVAFSEARRFQTDVRSDWMQVNIQKMDETLWHKFTQHFDLKEELLSTGDAELVEDSDKDAFWGVGSDRRGRNELGKALERLRTRLLTSGAWYRPALPTYSWKANSFDVSAPNQALCVVCGLKPRNGAHRFCSKTCANKASTLCNNCYAKKKFPPFDYCSKTCGALAKSKSSGGNNAPVRAPPGVVGAQAATNGNLNGRSNPFKPYVAPLPYPLSQPAPRKGHPYGQVNGSGQHVQACLIPGCNKPAYVDENGVASHYCSHRHRA